MELQIILTFEILVTRSKKQKFAFKLISLTTKKNIAWFRMQVSVLFCSCNSMSHHYSAVPENLARFTFSSSVWSSQNDRKTFYWGERKEPKPFRLRNKCNFYLVKLAFVLTVWRRGLLKRTIGDGIIVDLWTSRILDNSGVYVQLSHVSTKFLLAFDRKIFLNGLNVNLKHK